MENCLKIICCKSSVEKIPVREIKKTQTNKTFMASKHNFKTHFGVFWRNFIKIEFFFSPFKVCTVFAIYSKLRWLNRVM